MAVYGTVAFWQNVIWPYLHSEDCFEVSNGRLVSLNKTILAAAPFMRFSGDSHIPLYPQAHTVEMFPQYGQERSFVLRFRFLGEKDQDIVCDYIFDDLKCADRSPPTRLKFAVKEKGELVASNR